MLKSGSGLTLSKRLLCDKILGIKLALTTLTIFRQEKFVYFRIQGFKKLRFFSGLTLCDDLVRGPNSHFLACLIHNDLELPRFEHRFADC